MRETAYDELLLQGLDFSFGYIFIVEQQNEEKGGGQAQGWLHC
jgi:hypothetical protein